MVMIQNPVSVCSTMLYPFSVISVHFTFESHCRSTTNSEPWLFADSSQESRTKMSGIPTIVANRRNIKELP